MPLLTIREAADTVGTSKASIFRAIRAGRLSATRDDAGGFRVDPAELMRAFDPANRPRAASPRTDTPSVEQSETAPDTALQVRCASLEAEVKGLKDMVEELRRARDKWEAQAERLALMPPAPVTVTVPESRGFWPFRRRA